MKSVSDKATYAHIFIYKVRIKNHDGLLKVLDKLERIYRKHGALRTSVHQLEERSKVYDGFEGFSKVLKASSEDEIWIETVSYPNRSEFHRITAKIGEDADAGPLWEELVKFGLPDPIVMGEFTSLNTH
ncbi:MAG TPA: DUF1428 family protein [Candidatus Bathyarchaeia archaeon]|jgi:uncharacterized protein YbaA (DUF1428 family)|nr:DUF1428 family protein [Candidatus Bathyarchaeia archaeon]